jgi:hypothetical protein
LPNWWFIVLKICIHTIEGCLPWIIEP